MQVLGHSLVHSHHLLVRLLRTVCFAHRHCCTYLFICSLTLLTPELMGKWMIRCLLFLCFFLFWTIVHTHDTGFRERCFLLGFWGVGGSFMENSVQVLVTSVNVNDNYRATLISLWTHSCSEKRMVILSMEVMPSFALKHCQCVY